MSNELRNVFQYCREQSIYAFYKLNICIYMYNETVDLLLGLEAGGADIIELGIPFTDPLADGPTIQEANNVIHFKNHLSFLSSTFQSI